MLKVTNEMEIQSFSNVESHLQQFPFPCHNDNIYMKRLKWQLRHSKPVNEQGPRFLEQTASHLGIPTLLLVEMLKKYSPTTFHVADATKENQLDAEDLYKDEKQLLKSDTHRDLKFHANDFEQKHGFSLFSTSGLEWFFSNRLGAFFLDENGSATFDSTTKYEMKPNMAKLEAQIVFDLEDCKEIVFQSITISGDKNMKIVEQSDPQFQEAAQIIYSLAIMDCSIKWHAAMAHICIGELFNSAIVKTLSCFNPLRKFLHSFTHGVFEISNVVRMILIVEHGTLHTIFPFTAAGIQKYIGDVLENVFMLKDFSIENVFPCKNTNLRQDAETFWNVLKSYIDAFAGTADLAQNKEISAFVAEILRLSPNDKSRDEIKSAIKSNSKTVVQELLLRFMFHSLITHNLASLTNSLVSDCYVIPTMIEKNRKLHTVQTSERVMIAAHSSELDVLKFNQRWGDIVISKHDKDCGACKGLMNSIPDRLLQFEAAIAEKNKSRKYPNDSLDTNNMLCSISV